MCEAGLCMTIGAENAWLSGPCRDGEGRQAAGEIRAKQVAQLADAEVRCGARAVMLKCSSGGAPKKALDHRAAKGTDVIAAGGRLLEAAKQMCFGLKRICICDGEKHLIGEAERQMRGGVQVVVYGRRKAYGAGCEHITGGGDDRSFRVNGAAICFERNAGAIRNR